MEGVPEMKHWLPAAVFLFSYTAFAADTLPAPASERGPGGALKAKHAELKDTLAKNAFGRPLHMDSKEGAESLRGEVYAVLDHPFNQFAESLARPGAWCEILVMPMHIQKCSADGSAVAMTVATKLGPDAGEGVDLKFAFKAPARSADYFSTQLTAASGPYGTKDYRMALEATPLDATHTFIHITYAYAYGTMAKLGTQTYLSTSGKDKVGFTTGGMRGILERNAMRYLLAVDAYCASLTGPPDQRIDKRLKAWHASLERYPKQLHEPQPDYVQLKREQMAALAKRQGG
jgi:hypothetical protein